MTDPKGNVLADGLVVQFDDDYFGHGLTRELYVNDKGELGFNAIPQNEETFCYVKCWLREIEVVTDDTVLRNYGKHIDLNGNRYFV